MDEVEHDIIIIIIIIIITIIIIINNNGALGTVRKGMVENIKKVSQAAIIVTEIQKICMLGSAQILRKVLSV